MLQDGIADPPTYCLKYLVQTPGCVLSPSCLCLAGGHLFACEHQGATNLQFSTTELVEKNLFVFFMLSKNKYGMLEIL